MVRGGGGWLVDYHSVLSRFCDCENFASHLPLVAVAVQRSACAVEHLANSLDAVVKAAEAVAALLVDRHSVFKLKDVEAGRVSVLRFHRVSLSCELLFPRLPLFYSIGSGCQPNPAIKPKKTQTIPQTLQNQTFFY